MNPGRESLRAVLADDHHFSREGLRGILEADGIEVVGEAADGAEAVRLTASLAPDVVVLDLRMPGSTVGETISGIAATGHGARVVVLTVSAEEGDVIEALAGGANSYLLKDTPAAQLLGGIRETAAGSAVLAPAAMSMLLAKLGDPAIEPSPDAAVLSALSERELQVLKLIVDGAGNADIGRELSISRHTVKQHVTNIFIKLGVATRVEAAVRAVRDGLA
jgi:DNA-binding NarL/FixJ family response regulator